MKVQFHRTGERRYAIVVLREGQEPLRMDSAPGYDSLMPHDLQHLIVEQELGIRLGIFGQIAAGGTAGTFHHLHNGTNRAPTRVARRSRKKGKTLQQAGLEDAMFSERATYICWHHWLSAISDPRADDMADTARSLLALSPEHERKRYTPDLLQRVSSKMSALSKKWSSTPVGEYLEIEWIASGSKSTA